MLKHVEKYGGVRKKAFFVLESNLLYHRTQKLNSEEVKIQTVV